MSALEALHFEFEGQPLHIPIEESECSESRSTGRSLRRGDTSVQVAAHEVVLVKRLLDASPVADIDGVVWEGRLSSESYQDGGPHNLTISWREVEELNADTIEFAGLVLQPSSYKEHENDGGTISLAFQATLTAEETEKLRGLMPTTRSESFYHAVIRRGVSNEPRSMRLGRVLWQQLPDGAIVHDITFVDEAFDAVSGGTNQILAIRGEPELSHVVGAVSGLLGQIESLIAELETASTLPADAIARVRAAADESKLVKRHLFYEVADISKW